MSDLHYLSLGTVCARIKSGELTAVALTQAYLDRIASVDPRVQAFLTVTAEQALAAAEAADRRDVQRLS